MSVCDHSCVLQTTLQAVNKTTRKVFKSCGVNVPFNGKVKKLLNTDCQVEAYCKYLKYLWCLCAGFSWSCPGIPSERGRVAPQEVLQPDVPLYPNFKGKEKKVSFQIQCLYWFFGFVFNLLAFSGFFVSRCCYFPGAGLLPRKFPSRKSLCIQV